MIRIEIGPGQVPWDFAGGLVPKLFDPLGELLGAVYADAEIPIREWEAARIRIAQINGCALCLAFRTPRDGPAREDRSEELPEAFYADVEHWRESDRFTERERLSIEFAERWATDHRSFEHDEELWERLHANFTDRELVELALCVGACMLGGRFAHVFGLDVCDISAATRPSAVDGSREAATV